MKTYFDDEAIRKCQLHCKRKYPEEACGFITENDFIPVENKSEDRVKSFKIDKYDLFKHNDKIKAIVHSHADYPHLSKEDMLGQKRSGFPWGIVLLNKGHVEHTYFWGDQLEPQDLIGRPFIHGLYDCYAIVRDYWRHKGYEVKDFPRENLWWNDNPSMLEDGCEEAGFNFIDEQQLKVGDVIFMKVLSTVTNHSGIYIGNGLILHHLYNRLSREEPVHRWRKYITGFLRYKNA